MSLLKKVGVFTEEVGVFRGKVGGYTGNLFLINKNVNRQFLK